jgi:hypothetical protein
VGGGDGGEEINRLTILIARQRDSLRPSGLPTAAIEAEWPRPGTGLGAKPEKRGDRASEQPPDPRQSLVAKPIHMTSSLSKPDRFPSTTTRCPSKDVTF